MGNGSAPETEQRRSIVIDFDGTITEDDLLDEIARLFGDPAVYRKVENGLDAGTMPLREVITREFAPVTAPLEEVVAWVLDRVHIRTGFADLVRAAQVAGWGVHVVSSGFEELIAPVLEREGVDVELHANRVEARPEGWIVDWRYPDGCDECHESCKRSLLPGGYVIYVGDGYSDRCAALASDRVFATRGLATYLADRGTPFEPFDDFRSISGALANEMVIPSS